MEPGPTGLLVPLIRIAGGVQLAILGANVFLPSRLDLGRQLPALDRILRQMFWTHWIYILLVIGIFGALCLFFAPDLAGGSALGRALSAALALFWGPRLGLQLFFYDRAFTRRHAAAHLAFVAAFGFLGATFLAAAMGLGR